MVKRLSAKARTKEVKEFTTDVKILRKDLQVRIKALLLSSLQLSNNQTGENKNKTKATRRRDTKAR
jgi:hypothetical protein